MKYCLFLALGCIHLVNALGNNLNPVAGDVDLSLANLVLTAGDEKNFQYTFNLTNAGSSEVQGYGMRLTFSANNTLDANDNFFIIIPASNLAAQWIGPNQTLLKTEHYYATSPAGYLPIGSWYVFAEVNYDRMVPETNYNNDVALSTNKITVNNYTIPFSKFPTISSVTDNSFLIQAFFDGDLSTIYFNVQADGTPVPTKPTMLAATPIFPWESEVTVGGLGPAFAYDVYFMGVFPDGKTTIIYKVDVTTIGTAVPTVRLSLSELILDPVSKNKDSAPGKYTVTGYHLTANVVISSSGKVVVSKDNVTFSPQVSFPPSAFALGASQWVYVKYLSDGTIGPKAANISNATAGGTTINLPVTISIFDPVNGDFNGLTSLSETGWSAFSALGYHSWSLVDLEDSPPEKRVSGLDKAIQIDGSINGFTPNEDWLISPEVNLSGFLYDPTIKFKSFSSGIGSPLTLKYSANYSGVGDPRTATWFDADVDFPPVNSNEWKKSTVPVLNKESKIYFAFVYVSTNSSGSRWTIDDWSIKDNLLSIPTNTLTYSDVEVGTSSASQGLQVKIAGYGDITVTASAGFQVSLNNTTFSSSIVIPESEATAGKTIYVRFSPTIEIHELLGSLTFTAADLSVVRNDLVGSSLQTTAVGRPVEFTNFIYPNPTNGAVHLDLNTLYDQQGDVPVSVVNSIGTTVANFESPASSVELNISDVVSNLNPGLYYITIQTGDTLYRNRLLKL